MPKTRELIYVLLHSDEKKVVSYGIEFKEFIISLDKKVKNILVLEGNYLGAGFSGYDFNSRCEYSSLGKIDEFINEDVYQYGDFSWIDFETIEGLKALKPSEIAEILYLGKLGKPVSGFYFEKLRNRFAYISHDDGWFNMIYYHEIKEYCKMLGNLISLKIKKLYNCKVALLNYNVSDKLGELSKEGIVIDFDRFIYDDEEKRIEIPLFGIGKFGDMDKMCNDYKKHVSKAKFGKVLEHVNGVWTIQDWDYR